MNRQSVECLLVCTEPDEETRPLTPILLTLHRPGRESLFTSPLQYMIPRDPPSPPLFRNSRLRRLDPSGRTSPMSPGPTRGLRGWETPKVKERERPDRPCQKDLRLCVCQRPDRPCQRIYVCVSVPKDPGKVYIGRGPGRSLSDKSPEQETL